MRRQISQGAHGKGRGHGARLGGGGRDTDDVSRSRTAAFGHVAPVQGLCEPASAAIRLGNVLLHMERPAQRAITHAITRDTITHAATEL